MKIGPFELTTASAHSTKELLEQLLYYARATHRQGEHIMTDIDRINTAQDRQATALGNLAADVRELVTIIQTPGGPSPEQLATATTKAEALASAMESLSAEYKSAGE